MSFAYGPFKEAFCNCFELCSTQIIGTQPAPRSLCGAGFRRGCLKPPKTSLQDLPRARNERAKNADKKGTWQGRKTLPSPRCPRCLRLTNKPTWKRTKSPTTTTHFSSRMKTKTWRKSENSHTRKMVHKKTNHTTCWQTCSKATPRSTTRHPLPLTWPKACLARLRKRPRTRTRTRTASAAVLYTTGSTGHSSACLILI